MNLEEAIKMTTEEFEKENDKWIEDHFKYGFYMPTYEERKAREKEEQVKNAEIENCMENIEQKFNDYLGSDMIKKSDVALTKVELEELLHPFDFGKHLRAEFPEHITTTNDTKLLDILLERLHDKLD